MKLLKSKDPQLLSKVTKQVMFPMQPEVDRVIDSLEDTLRTLTGFWKDKAEAISAPQVGSDLRLFVAIDPRYRNNNS